MLPRLWHELLTASPQNNLWPVTDGMSDGVRSFRNSIILVRSLAVTQCMQILSSTSHGTAKVRLLRVAHYLVYTVRGGHWLHWLSVT